MAVATASIPPATPSRRTDLDRIAQFFDPTGPPLPHDFAFNDFLRKEYRFGIPPSQPFCKADAEGHCPLGNACPDRHKNTRIKDICKHWLKGLCKKGDQCEFLHEFNLRRMPECAQYSRLRYCLNGDECLYLHIDPESKQPPCPHYDRGFCPLGPRCSRRHVRRTLCPLYLAGFCPDGRPCQRGAHPRWPTNLPKPTVKIEKSEEELEAEQARLREEAEREEEREMERGNRGERGRGRGRGRFMARRRY